MGSFTQSGGTNSVANLLCLGDNAGSRGTYNLNGGLLTVATEIVGQCGTFNFNGGTLRAGTNSTTFLQSLAAAYVQAGGAIVDTQGFSVAAGQNLLHDPSLGAARSMAD